VTKLLRRGYLLGYRRARAKARREMDSLADEIDALQSDFAEIVELNINARDLDEAIVERVLAPDESLH
jgi:hypothetical protein